jgi:predicted NAD/FAD-binding protein
MKIAIVGSGIAGNVAAYHLHREHDITVFEAGEHVGGHTHTHDIRIADKVYAVDTGFIVYNDRTYPNFIRLLDELNVPTQKSNMSFSVRVDHRNLEYNGTSLNSLFAQRRNFLRPSFYWMIRDILRFNREAPELLKGNDDTLTLGDYLQAQHYGREFIDHYLVPMGAAVWSTDPACMLQFPARYLVRFFHNHGMLSVDDRPTWRVVRGGSRAYVERLTAAYRDRIRLNTPVTGIRRFANHVEITSDDGPPQHFDAVFIAAHSDQALHLLADPSAAEREVLSAIPYQKNEVVLHTDTRLLPKRALAWAAWNYHVPEQTEKAVAVTYNMNILQSIEAPVTFCVSLNVSAAIEPSKILKRLTYHHPLFTPAGVAAQQRQGELNGAKRTFYCGAYWRFGFHEDGVVSALNALEHFKNWKQNAQQPLRRFG